MKLYNSRQRPNPPLAVKSDLLMNEQKQVEIVQSVQADAKNEGNNSSEVQAPENKEE